jgi:hypothetical protein
MFKFSGMNYIDADRTAPSFPVDIWPVRAGLEIAHKLHRYMLEWWLTFMGGVSELDGGVTTDDPFGALTVFGRGWPRSGLAATSGAAAQGACRTGV